MTTEEESQINRITEPKRSRAAKLGWKKHHDNYMRANRKKERDSMNKSFYSVSKEIEQSLQEAKIDKDNVFDLTAEYTFDNISGGISLNVNMKENNISFSCILSETGQGNYKLENIEGNEEIYKNLYNDLKDELLDLCDNFDDNMKQILAKHGLKSTR